MKKTDQVLGADQVQGTDHEQEADEDNQPTCKKPKRCAPQKSKNQKPTTAKTSKKSAKNDEDATECAATICKLVRLIRI